MPGRKQENPQFKTTLYPVKLPDDLENWATWQTVCVPVPVPLIEFIPDILRPYRWKERWIGSDEQKQLAGEIWEDLINRFIIAVSCGETGTVFQLRQNSLNACQLQQSVDGGVSWTLAFDYSLCRSPLQTYQFELEANVTFNQWLEAETNTDIDPNAPTQTFISSDGEGAQRINHRRLALCYACKMYVDLYCETIKEINQDATTAGNITTLALGVVVALGTAGAIVSFGTSTLLAMAIAGAVGALGLAGYTALSDSVLEDEVARQAVACLMYDTLKDLAPTAENFATAVNSGTLTGNAELIRSTLAVDIGNEAGLNNQFGAFINVLGETLRPAELGLIQGCQCDDCAYVYDYNNQGLWEPVEGSTPTLDPTGWWLSGAFFTNPQWVIVEQAGVIEQVTNIKVYVDKSANSSFNVGFDFIIDGVFSQHPPTGFTDDGDTRIYYYDLITPTDLEYLLINVNSAVDTQFRVTRLELCS